MHLLEPANYSAPSDWILRNYRLKYNCTPRLNEIDLKVVLVDLEMETIESEVKSAPKTISNE